ncbi:hypothetical protein LMG9964_01764 [Paraburkholderia phenoliruptrix]|uniref:Uncharacterized protein n=1 Tax=Paraburkholderia phenoliruptrix TaxID=252970 RepID=A0A6J5K2X8_9BURK|nr:hypothetical protein LMG9964_01764 [Paraburkholderia phenoliruptrix]
MQRLVLDATHSQAAHAARDERVIKRDHAQPRAPRAHGSWRRYPSFDGSRMRSATRPATAQRNVTYQ